MIWFPTIFPTKILGVVLFFSLINMMVYTVIDKIWFSICKNIIVENSVYISFSEILFYLFYRYLIGCIIKKNQCEFKNFFLP